MAVDESDSEDSSSGEGNDNPSVDVDKARYPRGPRSAKSRDRINEALIQLIETGKRIAAEEKLPPEHIWSKLTAEVTVNKANSFNLFEKLAALELSAKRSTFFGTNPGSTEDDPQCPRPKSKDQILSEYAHYKKRAGDNLHQRLQNKIAKLQDQETQGMRFRQRQNAFDKTWGNVTEQLNHVSAVYGFESVILFGGNLAVDLFPDMCKIYETPGAKAFITEKVGDPLTVLQSHFRSHILNVHTETQVALKRMPSHADLEGVEWPLRLTGLDASKPWSQPTLETTEASATEYTESTPLDVLKQAVYSLMESMQRTSESFVAAAPPEVEKVLRGNTGSGVTYHAWLSWLTVLAATWGQYNVEYVLVNWPLSVRPPSRPEEIRLSQMSSKEYLSLIHAFKAGKGPVVRLRRPEDDSEGIVFGQNMEVLVTRDGKRTVTSQGATVLSGGPKGLKTAPATRQTRSHSSNTPSSLPENSPGVTTPGGAPSTVEKIEAPLVPRLPQVAPTPKKPAKKAAKPPAARGKAAKSAPKTGTAKKASGKAAGRKGKPKKAVEEDVEMDEADEEPRVEDTDELVEEEERYDYRALEVEGLAVVTEPNPPPARAKRGADVGTNAASTSESLPAKRVKIEQEQAERKTLSTPPPPVFNLQEPTPSAPRTIAQLPPPSAINPQFLAIPQPPPSAASPPSPSLEQESNGDCSLYTWEPENNAFLRNDLDGEEMRSIWTDPAHYRLAIGYGWVPFGLEGFNSEEGWVSFEFE
ncbi:hypothetical protein FRC00_001131 [Tulasnella sp. 408]|nr:hypothetical protein FRC00_001131 [Tulasnella sp. 408]